MFTCVGLPLKTDISLFCLVVLRRKTSFLLHLNIFGKVLKLPVHLMKIVKAIEVKTCFN